MAASPKDTEQHSDIAVATVTGHEPAVAARLFKALGDPIRVKLLILVRQSGGGEACFCDLAEEFDFAQSTLSHHLRILVDAGVLSRTRRGRWSWYRVEHEALDEMELILRAGGPLRASPGSNCGS
ncbi:ArsR/SmtB family transcription factor [Nocardia sp. NPDC058633]|uniref:ArsR/SmtB family transcription factor n=1 Tax=Nocardia sp. NPDC058633 TaxID=3346568 RepID=UPI003663BF7B